MSISYVFDGPGFDGGNSKLFVETFVKAKDTAYIAVTSLDSPPLGIAIPKDEAPAVALPILVAAGWTSQVSRSNVEGAVSLLRVHVQQTAEAKAKATAKAEDDAKLDAEALQLLNAANEVARDSFANGGDRTFWRRAALKARELYAPKDAA